MSSDFYAAPPPGQKVKRRPKPPACGPVERVWLDTGSGPGYEVPVPHGEPWWTATECGASAHGPKRMIG